MNTTIIVGASLARVIIAAHLSGHGVLLVGGTGVGKTAIIKALAARLGIGYRRLDASVLEASDLAGYPVERAGRMDFLRPSWMPDPDTEPDGIVVIEEATRPTQSVKNGLLNLISEKEINGHKLPPGWTIHGTANPATDLYQDAEELDAAFAARFSVIDVRASRKDWLAWAKKEGVHADVLNYVKSNTRVF